MLFYHHYDINIASKLLPFSNTSCNYRTMNITDAEQDNEFFEVWETIAIRH